MCLPLLLEAEAEASLEHWRDLEIWVMGHSRSLKMAPFDRSHTSSYSYFVVTMAVSCTVFEIKQDVHRKRQFFIPPSI